MDFFPLFCASNVTRRPCSVSLPLDLWMKLGLPKVSRSKKNLNYWEAIFRIFVRYFLGTLKMAVVRKLRASWNGIWKLKSLSTNWTALGKKRKGRGTDTCLKTGSKSIIPRISKSKSQMFAKHSNLRFLKQVSVCLTNKCYGLELEPGCFGLVPGYIRIQVCSSPAVKVEGREFEFIKTWIRVQFKLS